MKNIRIILRENIRENVIEIYIMGSYQLGRVHRTVTVKLKYLNILYLPHCTVLVL
jgi:hypothetical protein